MSEQTRNDLGRAARYIRSTSWPHDMRAQVDALADRLDGLADTIDLRTAVIEAAEKWRDTWPPVVIDEGDSTKCDLIAAVDALRADRQAGTT